MGTDLDGGDEFVGAPGLLPDAVVAAVGYRTVDEAPVIHRGIPSPALTFVLSLDDEPIVTGWSPDQATGADAYRQHTVLSGLHTQPAYIAQPRVQSGIQLAVRPLAARALFGMPASELRHLAMDGTDVLGASAVELRERLVELPTWGERFTEFARYLRGRWAPLRRRPPRSEVVEAWTWIVRTRGTGSVEALARHVGMSPRHLTTVFRGEVGRTPKEVSRLMRFENARQSMAAAIQSGTGPDIAAVAHACGYYDHSHLVRDFQQYVGASPTRWIAEERRNIQAGAHQTNADWAP